MKKAIALLVVFAVALSLSVVSFAATDIPYTYGANNAAGTQTNNATGNYGANNTTRMNRALTNNTDSNDVIFFGESGISNYAADILGGTDTYTFNAGEIILVNNGRIIGEDSLLSPNETYKFDLYYATGHTTGPAGTVVGTAGVTNIDRLTKYQVGDGTVRARSVKGSSQIQSAKIKTTGRGNATTYYLELETRANYGTTINDVQYTLSVLNASHALVDTTHLFRVGFNTISDSETDVGELGTITITNTAPVILKEQFTDIAKSANYKNVIFEAEDGNWSFTGKVNGMKDTNFSYNYDPDTDLLNRYPEHDFKFLNFPAGVNFPTSGEMRIDVSDVSGTFGTMYAYLYREGRLTEIAGTYESGADQIVFRTNYLGRFVITDRPITEASIVPEEPTEIVPVPEVPQNQNPHTGASTVPNAIAAIGLLTLASGAVIRRKSK
jgi:hypothetical protein